MQPVFNPTIIATALFLCVTCLDCVAGFGSQQGRAQTKVQRFEVTVGDAPDTFEENTYVVFNPNTKDTLIIDPGMTNSAIDTFISVNNLKVKAILNTHGHFDHIGGNEYYCRKYKTGVFAYVADKWMYEDEARAVKFFVKGQEPTVPGFDISVFYTPGHTAGSVCYLINGMLFSGDTLFKGGVGRIWGRDKAEQEQLTQQLVSNIKNQLLPLPDETPVYPGHGDKTTIAAERARARFTISEPTKAKLPVRSRRASRY